MHNFSAGSPSSPESSSPHDTLDFLEPPSSWLLFPQGQVCAEDWRWPSGIRPIASTVATTIPCQ
uniref:Uncharacterized protein n=1 Tax=Arundo donax TaxID=35708 RepID=A0A0A9T755_ARUDO